MTFTTRFAPSPTGPLHLGHAYSALLAYDMALASDGTFHLRIEDIDQTRSRPEWEEQIYDDLAWLGLSWEAPVMRQSERLPAYREALARLWQRGLLYPCNCSRRDIAQAVSAPQEGGAPPFGPDGLIYPNTCRHVPDTSKPLPEGVLRLNMEAALAGLADDLSFEEVGPNAGVVALPHMMLLSDVGDVVLARHGMGASYHLSVVLDDAAQNITDVVRGQDLFTATYIHVVLQRLLGLPTPHYHHHRLIRDAAGKRLAKRDDARAIATYRAEGRTAADIRRLVGL